MTNLPLILIVDDLFGRYLPSGSNEDRENLCINLKLRDVTDSFLPDTPVVPKDKVPNPVAEAVFIRGQEPACSSSGDTVCNDLNGVLDFIRKGWREGDRRWSMVLLDLCFYTGKVTGYLSNDVAGSTNEKAEAGMPEGQANDISPSRFFGLKILEALKVTEENSEFNNL
ncbi:MAG: hypothetical protein MPJ24_09625, partial [Pirellulaceae bacterium]|nr:hypothetical protein [Pirellulaceae bacterium]